MIVTVFLLAATLRTLAQESAEAFDFTENKGQWDKQVRFRGDVPAGAFYLHNNGFTVVQHNGDDLDNFFHRHHLFTPPGGGKNGRPDRGPNSKPPGKPGEDHTIPAPTPIRSHAYRVYFVGANENSQFQPDKQVQTSYNYFIGNDPAKWATNVPVFQAVLYKDIYPNIDIRYYSAYGRLKYDIIVHPGGDPSKIVMRYEGAEKLSVKKNELIIKTSVGDLKEMYPYSYQFDMTNGKKEVACDYVIDGNTVRFKLASYSKTATLVIDPTLVFCSFTGSAANQYGYTATPGPDGSLYSGGIVFGQGFPTSPGAYQTGFGGGDQVNPDLGGIDMGIFKFSPDGSRRMYATYIGGNRNDYPHSLICDPQGNLVVMGKTYSTNFMGTLVGQGGGADIAVVKLNATGTNIIGALRIGGSGNDGLNIADQIQSGADQGSTFRFYGDDSRSEVILDGNNNIYVAAQTQSTSGAGLFPVTTGAFQTTPGGAQDGVVMKINPNCTDVLWASFLGGSGDDGAFVLSLNPTNNEVYVGGATTSGTGFPGNKSGVHQGSFQGGVADGFISRISNNGSTIQGTTFLGTDKFDAVYGLKFDRAGNPYAMGVTEGAWPVVNAPYSNANSKQFIVKMRPDLSGFIYSTVFGNGSPTPNISPVAFLVDRCENIYISGWGGWIQPGSDPFNMGGLGSMPISSDAFKRTTDNRDFYFIVIKRDATELMFATYFGQSGGEGEHVDGGTSRYDDQGVVYQAICANCFGSRAGNITQSFPTTRGVWAERNGSRDCNLAAVKIAFNFAGVGSGPRAFFNNRLDTVGCVPFTVNFRDTVRNAKSYEWDFDGDGNTDFVSDTYNANYTFNNVGTYRVRLIAIDDATCNQRDTAYVTIRVRSDEAQLAFDAIKDGPCESLGFNFFNNSVAPAGKPFGPGAFAWDFGDGTPIVPATTNPVKHEFPAPGTYPIRLILLDTSYCNGGDWLDRNLGVAANVEARVETPATGCAPYDAIFNNTSLGGHDYLWDFGDGTTSTEMSPTHLYPTPGNYNIRLIVQDSNTCNKIDTLDFSITVHPSPTASITHTPVSPEVNKPTTFIVTASNDAIRFHWDFGDADTLITYNRNDVQHQYNATGEFVVRMTAYNKEGCSVLAYDSVQSLIDPLLDVPNAFTPGRGNRTSIVKVLGFGVEKMTWRIYNRWGQKVFETTDRRGGWDGYFQGKLQPMDVYSYTLDVVFTDGRPLRKTGDITLIR